MRRVILFAVSLVLWEAGLGSGAGAGPIVALRGATAFSAAIRATSPPTLRPVSPTNGFTTQQKIFPPPPPAGNSQLAPTVLYTNSVPFNGMISATGSAANLNQRINGGYIYNYKLDPDLSNLSLNLELFFPQVGAVGSPGIDTLGVALTDISGNDKIWRFDNTVLTAGVPEDFSINLDAGLGSGGSTSFFMDPGFDLHNVLTIQVADAGTLTTSFPAPPPADPEFPPAPDTALWFATEQFVVVPEPGPLLFLSVVIAGGAAWRGRRRKHNKMRAGIMPR